MIKFTPRKTSKSIARGTLTSDERVVLHRAVREQVMITRTGYNPEQTENRLLVGASGVARAADRLDRLRLLAILSPVYQERRWTV